MVVLGLGLGVAQPLTMAWVADAVRPEVHGGAMGLRLAVNRLLQTALPLGVGVLSGPAAVFPLAAGVLVASSAVLLRLPSDRPPSHR
jgi:MFS family permease